MNRFSLVLILLLVLLVSNSIYVQANSNIDANYTTVTGEVKLVGTGELNNAVLIGNDKKYYVTGELENELKQLINISVKITGNVSYSNLFNADGKINVIDYTISDLSGVQDHQDWVFGKVYQSEKEFVLISRNQVIYRITNFEDLSINNIEENKLLLIGSVKKDSDFFAEIEVSSYKVIKTNN